MERSSSSINCVYTAISQGIIPARFSQDGKELIFNTIPIVDVRGNQSTWTIKVMVQNIGDDPSNTSLYIPFNKTMLSRDKLQEHDDKQSVIKVVSITHKGNERNNQLTVITEGKHQGKANFTNPITQGILNAFSKYKLKLKNANSKIMVGNEDVDTGINPMLVQKWPGNDIKSDILIERKFDGIRVLCKYDMNGMVEMKSRAGHRFLDMDLICSDLCHLFNAYDGDKHTLYLDGEIYKHGVPLQDISGAVRGARDSKSSRSMITANLKNELKLYLFDCFDTSNMQLGALERKRILSSLFAKASQNMKLNHVVEVEYYSIPKEEATVKNIQTVAEQFETEGYEGAIIRKVLAPYEPSVNNYHSSNIYKVKPVMDSEFPIVDIKDGNTGKEKGAVIFVCSTLDDPPKRFNAVPKGLTYPQRYHIFRRLEDKSVMIDGKTVHCADNLFHSYLYGKLATIQYSQLSKDGVPMQPKFKNLRVEDPNDIDIISILAAEV